MPADLVELFKRYWPWAVIAVPSAAAAAVGLKAATKKVTALSGPPTSTIQHTGVTALTSYLSDSFFKGVEKMAEHMRSRGATISAEDLLNVFKVESDVKPHVANKDSGCAGLNQICNLKAVGWTGTRTEYLALPGDQQLQYVQKYFDNVNRYPAITDTGKLYLANFNPGHLGKAESFVLYRKGQIGYTQNSGLDFGGKGFIEIADMTKFVRRGAKGVKWEELRSRMAQAQGLI